MPKTTKKVTKKLGSAKKAAKKVVKKVLGAKKDYSLSISYNDVVYKTKADSLIEALTDFSASKGFSPMIKTKVVFLFSKGDVERRMILPIGRARVVFKQMSLDPNRASLFAKKLTQQLS